MTQKQTTLLIVEDEPNLLLGIRDILSIEGFAVITATDGQMALDALENCHDQVPDLILSDISMPVMDGIEFLQVVRQRKEWVKIPFIFLTARGERDDVNLAKLEGVDDYLIKPFDADELLVAVRAKLDRYTALRQVRETEVSKVKRDIMVILNHEFRTPLTLVVAYSEMLKEMLRGRNVSEMEENDLLEFLREVNVGAARLRRLVENFILLAELQTGDSQKNYDWRCQELNDVSAIIESAYKQVITPEVKNPCTVTLPDHLPAIFGDFEYLVTILRELLLNAVKFSDDPTTPIAIEVAANNQNVRIEIIDNGRGIPDSERAEIWKTFYQIDRDLHEDQGAGSGLAISQGLAKLHNGRVELVETAVGKGSRFALILPTFASGKSAIPDGDALHESDDTGASGNAGYTAQFKFDVVIEGLRGKKSMETICQERSISKGLYQQWQQHFLMDGPKLFES